MCRISLTVLPQVPGPVGGRVSVLRPEGQGTFSFWTSRRTGVLRAGWYMSAEHAHVWCVLLPEAGSLTGVFVVAVAVNSARSLDPWTRHDRSSPPPPPASVCFVQASRASVSHPHTPLVRPAGWDCRAVGPPLCSRPSEVSRPFRMTAEHTLLVGPAAGGRGCAGAVRAAVCASEATTSGAASAAGF